MEKKTLVPIVGIHSSGKSTILDILNKKGKDFLNNNSEIIVKNKKAKIREEK